MSMRMLIHLLTLKRESINAILTQKQYLTILKCKISLHHLIRLNVLVKLIEIIYYVIL